MRQNLMRLALVVAMAGLLAACGAGRREGAKSVSPAGRGAVTDGSAQRPAEQGTPTSPGQGVVPAPATGTAPAADQDGQPLPALVTSSPVDRKIILNAQFDVKVKNGDDAVAKIGQAVRAAGGYVQESRQGGTKQEGRTINMTLRVPAGEYGRLVDLIAGLGEVAGRREWTDDVTEQFVDLEARIKTKEAHLAQLRKLYEKGGSIKEMMELEAEVNRVTAELESLQGKMRFLKDRVEYSTIIVNLYEPGAPAPIAPPKSVWERMQRGFIESWNGVVNFTGDMAVLVVSAIPVLFYLAVVAAVLYPLYRVARRLYQARFRQQPPQDND
jgi:hypothetical protein